MCVFPCKNHLCTCLHKSSVLNLWPNPFVMSEDGDEVVFLLLLTDNSHNKKRHTYLTHVQTLACQATAVLDLINLLAWSLLSGGNCLLQAQEQPGGETKTYLKPPFQIHAGDSNKCQGSASPSFQPQGNSCFPVTSIAGQDQVWHCSLLEIPEWEGIFIWIYFKLQILSIQVDWNEPTSSVTWHIWLFYTFCIAFDVGAGPMCPHCQHIIWYIFKEFP